ncbi:MAG: hypothetical protein ACFFEY_03845 [Candidatus Thorarchaeota archaeon]
MVNRSLDYGFNWMFSQNYDIESEKESDNRIYQQITFFYEKEKNRKGYIKALFLHHLLDFFKETHVNIYDLDLVFTKFQEHKIISEIVNSEGTKVTFHKEINEIFDLIRLNKEEILEDLKI